ncbi:MAG: sensor histidine kinase [Exilispira sp.]
MKSSKRYIYCLDQVSHEFKNPLTLLLGYIQILEKNEEDKSKKQALQNMKSISLHIIDIISNILDIARINIGKMTLNLEEIDLLNLLNDVIDSNKIIAKNKGLSFEYSIDKELPGKLKIDQIKLRQILNNLLSNAIKYTNNGFVRLNVKFKKITQNSKKGDLIIEVIDSGIGLKKNEIEKIFDDFYRGADSLNIEGTGLGLPISKKLAQIMNGQISVESEKGVGSKFILSLKDVEYVD